MSPAPAALEWSPPRYGRHLRHVLPAAAGALGCTSVADAAASQALLGLPSVSKVVVVLVDGLGAINLAERSGHAPVLRRLLAAAGEPLSAGYPSTTAASLASFGTGRTPGETGLVGYTVRNPDGSGLLNLVSWSPGVDPVTFQPHRTVLQQLDSAGLRVVSVGPARFDGSGLTQAALRGPRYRGIASASGWASAIVDELRLSSLVYGYWGDVDKTGHHHGTASLEWGDALAAADEAVGELIRTAPRGTLVIVTADHGMVDQDPAHRWDVGTDLVLGADVPLTAGEPRALHLHLREGADPAVVARRWAEHLGEAAEVATKAQAIGNGWFGTVEPRVDQLLGDVVVAMRGRATVVDSRTQTPASLELVGVHGSMTAVEMLVPLLVTVT